MQRTFTRALVVALALAATLVATASAATPTVVTNPVDPADVTDTYAFVGGSVNPNGDPTVYKFVYGETTAYGSETPTTSAGNAKIDVPVNTSFDDLKPNTTYHFQLVAFPDPSAGPYYGVAQTTGGDQTFTTSASASVAFASTSAPVKNGRAAVSLTAAGPSDGAAKGKVQLVAKIKTVIKKKVKVKVKVGKGKNRHTVTRTKVKTTTKSAAKPIGSASYSINVGKTKTIKVTLKEAALKQLRKKGKLKATATATTKGVATPVKAKLTLKG